MTKGFIFVIQMYENTHFILEVRAIDTYDVTHDCAQLSLSKCAYCEIQTLMLQRSA